jgi:hypothetical protein
VVHARNTGADSANAIHHDDVARRYGFNGGLVPGVTVYAYMVPAPVGSWGVPWLKKGSMTARFHKPFYDGDDVHIEAKGDRLDQQVVALNAARETCAIAGVHWIHDETPPNPSKYERGDLPDPVPPATEEALAAMTRLGSIHLTLSDEVVEAFLTGIDEPMDLYRRERIAHPAHLLWMCNSILAANVTLGPWIHVQSDCSHFDVAHWGERLEARGRVDSLYEKKGHKFVDLDVAIFGDRDRPLMRVRHVAIYEPAQVGRL